ncbi:unnamed protein product [Amoebophrya sp. A120]|nr:unnamed protein product [Amoebophrya sp. A120]|eukprot:GSA120T00012776001.1
MGRAGIQIGQGIIAVAILLGIVTLFLPWSAQQMISGNGFETAIFYLHRIYLNSSFSIGSNLMEAMKARGYTRHPCVGGPSSKMTIGGHEMTLHTCWSIPTWKAALHGSSTAALTNVDATGILVGGILSGENQMMAVMYGGVVAFVMALGCIVGNLACILFIGHYANSRASAKTRKLASLMLKLSTMLGFTTAVVYLLAVMIMSKERGGLFGMFSSESAVIPREGFFVFFCVCGVNLVAMGASKYWKSDTSEFLTAKDKLRKNMDLMAASESEDDYDDWTPYY